MNILSSIWDIVRRIFGADPALTQEEAAALEMQSADYRRLQGYNLTAIFAAKLATLTIAESSAEVSGDNQRAQLIDKVITKLWKQRKKLTAMAYGTGGVLLIPYVTGGKVYVDIVPQSSMIINRVNGDDIRAVSIVADSAVQGNRKYYRWTDYILDDSGMMSIRNRATNDSGGVVALTDISAWADVTEEVSISGVEDMLFAYIKCPVDNRQTKSFYGVPITYGCKDKIDEITECMDDIRKEYKLKQPIVGMDTTLFKVENGRRHLPRTGLFMPTNPRGLNESGKLWEVYDPAIRDSAYYNRLEKLFEELEKQVGTSRGILTEQATHGATATEIKAANYDTYAIVDDMRQALVHGIEQLAYAIDVLINAYSLGPIGEYEVNFDWSYSMIESSEETFNQLLAGQQIGAAEVAEVRMFLYPNEDIEAARERVAEIQQAKAEAQQASDLLLQEQLARESQQG